MRRSAALAGLALALLSVACTHRTRGPVSYRETKTFPATAGKLVRLELASLDLLVRAAEATEITVTVALEARSGSGRAAQRWVAQHTPVFEDSESTLEVRLPRRSNGVFVVGMLHTSATVEVTIPPGCRLEVRSASGDVELEGTAALAGPVRLNTASGDVGVRGGAASLVVTTASGAVRVAGRDLETLEVETASGDVTVEATTGKALVDTASGSIRLRSLTGDLSVDTTSGDVRASWRSLPATGRVSVRTTSSDVRLRLPVTPALAGRLSTSSGRIVSDVDGVWGRSHRSLEIGAAKGGVELDVRTTSGDIHLDTTRAEL